MRGMGWKPFIKADSCPAFTGIKLVINNRPSSSQCFKPLIYRHWEPLVVKNPKRCLLAVSLSATDGFVEALRPCSLQFLQLSKGQKVVSNGSWRVGGYLSGASLGPSFLFLEKQRRSRAGGLFYPCSAEDAKRESLDQISTLCHAEGTPSGHPITRASFLGLRS